MTNVDNLPSCLKEEALFCCWRYETGADGKPTKVPYNPKTGAKAKANHSETFTNVVEANLAQPEYDGMGIGVFKDFCAVDIDHCIDENNVPSAMAVDIVKRMDSYTETSPSGKGLRILFRAPGLTYNTNKYYINKRAIGLEVYVAGATTRFVTVTGNVIRKRDIENRSEELATVLDDYMLRAEPLIATDDVIMDEVKSILSDEEVIAKASRANNAAKFVSLWNGDYSALFESQSEAVASLLRMLAFWTRRDMKQMDRLFRQSGLMYPDGKWDRPQNGTTWGTLEIKKALAYTTDIYTPTGKGGKDDFRVVLKAAGMGTFKPSDFTDVGAARVFAQYATNRIIYVGALGWLVWNGKWWEENEYKAMALAKTLTDCMLGEAGEFILQAKAELTAAKAKEDAAAEEKAEAKSKSAEEYFKFVLKERSQPRIKAMLDMSKDELLKELKDIDANPFVLNTPDGIVDLRNGTLLPHDPGAYCAKITLTGPLAEGEDPSIWENFLHLISCGDKELEDYIQIIAGMAAIGRVFVENLVIAYGEGQNGKSTIFNALQNVLGDYSGGLPAEIFTSDKSKIGALMAELKGKRLAIAPELAEGQRLSGSILKRVASTDRIDAERKYKDPERFKPSHTTILYTNHLPRLSSVDKGTRRRITLLPFKATISEASDIKNYAEYLSNHCGGTICQWIIDGARSFIEADYKITMPDSVKEDTENYFADNDWMALFLDECCEVGKGMQTPGGGLHEAYKDWAKNRGDYVRPSPDFTSELRKRGFESQRASRGVVWKGLMLRPKVWQGSMSDSG